MKNQPTPGEAALAGSCSELGGTSLPSNLFSVDATFPNRSFFQTLLEIAAMVFRAFLLLLAGAGLVAVALFAFIVL